MGGKGFESHHYNGFMDIGKSKADVVIESFEELKTIFKNMETQNEREKQLGNGDILCHFFRHERKHPLPDVMRISDRCWELTPS